MCHSCNHFFIYSYAAIGVERDLACICVFLFVSVFVFVFVFLFVVVLVHICVCICVCTCVCIFVCICVCLRSYLYLCLYLQVRCHWSGLPHDPACWLPPPHLTPEVGGRKICDIIQYTELYIY